MKANIKSVEVSEAEAVAALAANTLLVIQEALREQESKLLEAHETSETIGMMDGQRYTVELWLAISLDLAIAAIEEVMITPPEDGWRGLLEESIANSGKEGGAKTDIVTSLGEFRRKHPGLN